MCNYVLLVLNDRPIHKILLQLEIEKTETCHEVCTMEYDFAKPEDMKKLDFLKKGIKLNYQHHW